MTSFTKRLLILFVLVYIVPLSNSIQNDSDVEGRIEFLQSSMARMEQRILTLTKTVNKLSRRKNEEHVMFYATLSSDTVLNINSIVKFNEIQFDEGADFNSGDGVFVSPVSGVFMFAWTTLTHGGKSIDTELRVDNVVKAQQIISLGSSAGSIQTTQFVICRVKEKDHVWIETGAGFTTENFFDHLFKGSKSSFMGILIHVV
ncbi:uncharacterized protein LOC127719724 [Mytilus californianus]|uniref:uncharacterized protein LOC127719724 n=1 Tax=Mytilus californianus TaxID=6549 RepID=UPI002246AEF8|nr:uncharacterized protein LOC127719724 [Mytilus californianus]